MIEMDMVIRNFPDNLDLRVFIDRLYPHLSDSVTIEQCNGYDAETTQQPSMKKISVNTCLNCPLKEPGFNEQSKPYFKCTHAATDGCEIEDMCIIPEWCELEDD